MGSYMRRCWQGTGEWQGESLREVQVGKVVGVVVRSCCVGKGVERGKAWERRWSAWSFEVVGGGGG